MKKFSETIKGAAVGSDTKKVVQAASDGDLKKYKKALKTYSWPRTRDYTMVLLIFSPIVAAINAVNKMEDADYDSNANKDFVQSVDRILRSQEMNDLCTNIGRGDGVEIKRILNSFTEYKGLLKILSYDKYGIGGPSDKFMERAGKITSWVRNEGYINEKLIPFVKGTLGSKFAANITKGLVHVSKLTEDDFKDELHGVLHSGKFRNTATFWAPNDLETSLPYSDNEDYQALESRISSLPKRIRITQELIDLFNRFGEKIEGKILYITEPTLYRKLNNIITKKIKTYTDLDDVSEVYKKYVILYNNNRNPYAIGPIVGWFLTDDVYDRLFVQCAVARIPNFDKTKNIDFQRIEKTIELLDGTTLKEVLNDFEKSYGIFPKYYTRICNNQSQDKPKVRRNSTSFKR